MCGIAAAIHYDGAKEKVEKLTGLLNHRGDFSDPILEVSKSTVLGMRRLRILDWKNATQPFWSYDSQWVIVFNGEIYNYQQLRSEQEKRGVSFKTDADTEVLVNGIAIYGEQFVEQLNGMFAFVAYNPDQSSFIAARDHMGIKPLYYSEQGEGYLFASEMWPLLEATEKEDVRTCKPGTIISNGHVKQFQFKATNYELAGLKKNAEQLLELLDHAVKIRIPDDTLKLAVKFGGGIDSTLILHLARKYRQDVSAYFIGNEKGKDFKYASEYASKTNLDLISVPYDPNDIFDILEDVILTVETFEPTIIRNAIFSYLLSQRIHEDGIKVALCGEGADEIFWGYPEMRTAKNIPARSKLFLNDLHRTQLRRVDRCSMKFQLETRVPFLDPQVVHFTESIPGAQKIGYYENRVMEKIILREIYKLLPSLPDSIRKREKAVLVDGAGMSDNDRFSGPFFEYASEQLTEADYADGLKKFKEFGSMLTKEEVFYLHILESKLDIKRLPELRKRPVMNRKIGVHHED